MMGLRRFRTSGEAMRTLSEHERGIPANIPPQLFAEPPEIEGGARRQVRWLPISLIEEPAARPHIPIDCAKLDELAASIRQVGLIQPITVRLTASGRFELIAGLRRLRACGRLGMTHIDAIVLPAGELDCDIMSAAENMQREPAHYIDEAEKLDAILRKNGLSVHELSGMLGITAYALSTKLRLMRIPQPTRRLIREQDISERFARLLIKLNDASDQLAAAQKIAEKRMSLTEAETMIDSLIRNNPLERRRVTGIVRDHRPYVNAMRELTDQMRRTGFDASIDVRETDGSVEVLVRMEKHTQTRVSAAIGD